MGVCIPLCRGVTVTTALGLAVHDFGIATSNNAVIVTAPVNGGLPAIAALACQPKSCWNCRIVAGV